MSLLRHQSHARHHSRSFVNVRIKWVKDPQLDDVVQREKNIKPFLNLKTIIQSSPTGTLPISSLKLPFFASKFIHKHPSLFHLLPPSATSASLVRLSIKTLNVAREELILRQTLILRLDLVHRLSKFLMLARSKRLPFPLIDSFAHDLGLPHNYVTSLLPDFPEYFQVSSFQGQLCLELASWRDDLAVSEIQRMGISYFPMNLPRGFDFERRMREWVEAWQGLPYISPYEDAFHLSDGDLSEKWVVAVLHELLHITVSKKTERDNVFRLGNYLGFELQFKRALVRHPGIFYVSNKIQTQTVVLREAHWKDFLILKHPLMGMRYQYIHLMNLSTSRGMNLLRISRNDEKQDGYQRTQVSGIRKS